MAKLRRRKLITMTASQPGRNAGKEPPPDPRELPREDVSELQTRGGIRTFRNIKTK